MAQVWRVARIIAGTVLIGIGVIGLFLPFLQGIALIIAGLLLLAREFHWARRVVDWLRSRWGTPRASSPGSGE
jgi:uncharacterized protein YqgC (DUF456 family)